MISSALAVLEKEEERNELSDIYQNNIKIFYKTAYSKLHNRHDAQDAIQEAFLSAANNPDIFFAVPPEKRVPYMIVIIRNISCRIWNNKHKEEINLTELDDNIPDKDPPIEERVSSQCSREEIYSFIDTLPESEKAAVYLKIHLDMKYREIAKALGISEEAAKKRITRAISKIRRFTEDKTNE